MIVIVIGMHRSGTSALAGILHLNEIIMGEESIFRPKPLPQNPKGFYENYLFRKINDKMLEKYGYKVKSFKTDIPRIEANDQMKQKMKKLLLKYQDKYTSWGWKDPRTCLTLSIWLDILNELNLIDSFKILFTIRNAQSVTRSLVKRDGLKELQALMLWNIYNKLAIKAVDKYSIDTFYFTYEQLIKEPVLTTQAIFKFLEHNLDESLVNKFIDQNLNRSQEGNSVDFKDKFFKEEFEAFNEMFYSRLSI